MMPPTNGPIILVPGMVNTFVAYALLRESGGTVLAISACFTGILIDSQLPATKAYANACQTSTISILTMNAKEKAKSAIKLSIPIMSLRRSSRSPITPPQGPMNIPGSAAVPPTPTTRRAEFAPPSDRYFTSHPRVNS